MRKWGTLTIVETLETYGRALTADELAQILALPKKTIYKMAKKGTIPSFKVGGSILRFCGASVAKAL